MATLKLSLACFLVPAITWTVGVNPTTPSSMKGVTANRVEYKGWKNNLRLRNDDAELIVTLDVGPRIISYRLLNHENVFKEYADQLGKSGEKDWQIRGGHRLWVAPEDLTRTYHPDNGPVNYLEKEGQYFFTTGPDKPYGIQKVIAVRMAASGSRVTVTHLIKNVGAKPTMLSPWAQTVMAPGGIEIIPLPPKKDHPGPPANAQSAEDYAPNQRLALWPYFDFTDDRFKFGSKFITVRQRAQRGPTKIGLAHRMGWVAYLNRSNLFIKRFKYEDGKTYPDMGSNFETFTNGDMLEIETLGPLVTLAPSETATLIEQWELIPDVAEFKGEAGIEIGIVPKVTGEAKNE